MEYGEAHTRSYSDLIMKIILSNRESHGTGLGVLAGWLAWLCVCVVYNNGVFFRLCACVRVSAWTIRRHVWSTRECGWAQKKSVGTESMWICSVVGLVVVDFEYMRRRRWRQRHTRNSNAIERSRNRRRRLGRNVYVCEIIGGSTMRCSDGIARKCRPELGAFNGRRQARGMAGNNMDCNISAVFVIYLYLFWYSLTPNLNA